jgi:uncharacterized protein (DUF2336 family)
MIIKRFLLWSRTAPPAQRAAAIGALCRAYVDGELELNDRFEAETAMTAMLDDASPLVRRAVAEALADAAEAPRHVVLGLASDQSDIAATVLARSPLLADPDLVDCVAIGDDLVQTAVARRRDVSAAVSGALAEIGGAEAVTALLDNRGAMISDGSLSRIVDRLGSDATVREALLARDDLPLDIRQAVAHALSRSLAAFVAECGWLSPERSERATREAREKTTVDLSGVARADDVRRLVTHLRTSAQLTPALILRALLSRALPFAEAAFADLSGLPVKRVSRLMQDRHGSGFAALYRRAGLPDRLRPAFAVAVAATRRHDAGQPGVPQLSRRVIADTLMACATLPPRDGAAITALLRRYDVEAAREEARELAGVLADEAALASILRHMPELIEDELRPERLLAA